MKMRDKEILGNLKISPKNSNSSFPEKKSIKEMEDIKVDLEEMKEFKRKNFQDRLDFIKFQIDYMKKKSDREWSKSQADFIDAQFEAAKRFWRGHGESKEKEVFVE